MSAKPRPRRWVSSGLPRLMAPLVAPLMVMAAAVAHAGVAHAAVDLTECETQLRRVLDVEMSCTIGFVADDTVRQTIRQATGGAVEDVACRLPIVGRKRDIYNSWITSDRVAPPTLPLTCYLGAGQGAQRVVTPLETAVDIACRRQTEGWQCTLALSGTRNAGVLGQILEAMVNSNPVIQRSLGEALDRIDRTGI